MEILSSFLYKNGAFHFHGLFSDLLDTDLQIMHSCSKGRGLIALFYHFF